MLRTLGLLVVTTAVMSVSAAPLLQKIAPNVWIYGTDFNFLNVVPFGNNGMLVNTEHGLVAIGAPQLSDQLKTELKELTATLNTEITHVLCTDWHHLFSPDWGTNFTTATVYYTGIRGWRFHQDVDFKKAILDVDAPVLPKVFEEISLIPIRGFRGPGAPLFSRLPDEVPRTEVAVLLPKVKLLYIFDLVLCTVSSFDYSPFRYRSNFGPSALDGFQTNVTALAQETQKSFSRLPVPVEQLVFAHGNLEHGCHVQGAAKVQELIQKYILDVAL